MTTQTAFSHLPFFKRVQFGAIVQLISGVAVFVISLACHFEQCFAGFLAVGTWTGMFYAINAFLCFTSARTRISCLAILCMILSLLAAMFSLMATAMAAVGILVESDLNKFATTDPAFQKDWFMMKRYNSVNKRIFLHSAAIIGHGVQIIASICQSIFAFRRYLYFETVGTTSMGSSLVISDNKRNSIPLQSLTPLDQSQMEPLLDRSTVIANFKYPPEGSQQLLTSGHSSYTSSPARQQQQLPIQHQRQRQRTMSSSGANWSFERRNIPVYSQQHSVFSDTTLLSTLS